MTTDFLVTLADAPDTPPRVALSVKPSSELEAAPGAVDRLLAKAEIERRYWDRRGVPFRMVTDREMPAALVSNLDLVLPCRTLDAADYGLPEAAVPGYLGYLYDQLASATGVPFNRVCAAADAQLRLRSGTCLTLVWHAVASKRWAVSMHERLDPDQPLRGLRPGRGPHGAPAPRPNASTALLFARTAAEQRAAAERTEHTPDEERAA